MKVILLDDFYQFDPGNGSCAEHSTKLMNLSVWPGCGPVSRSDKWIRNIVKAVNEKKAPDEIQGVRN